MAFNGASSERQPDAEPFHAASVDVGDLVERVEHALEFALSYPWAVVLNLDLDPARIATVATGDLHLTARTIEQQGVFDQLQQRVGKPRRVPGDGQIFSLQA